MKSFFISEGMLIACLGIMASWSGWSSAILERWFMFHGRALRGLIMFHTFN
jgi:hypothetical protein